jgi:hypothetical protein
MFLVSVKIIPFENASDVPFWGYWIILFVSIAFTLIGGGLVFGRIWKMIDLEKGTLLKTTGTIFHRLIIKQEEYHLNDYQTLRLRYDSGDSDSPETYPIFLAPRNNLKELLLITASSYKEALEKINTLSNFLKYSVEDYTSEHSLVIAPGNLDDILIERLRYSREKDKIDTPMTLKSKVSRENGQTKIFIPGPGFKKTSLIPLAIFLIIILIFGPVVMDFFGRTHTPQIIQYIFFGIVTVFFFTTTLLGLISNLIGAKRAGTLVLINQAEFVIEQRKGWSTKREILPIVEILDIDYSTAESLVKTSTNEALGMHYQRTRVPLTFPYENHSQNWWFKLIKKVVKSQGITIKTKRGIYSFGAGLDDMEVKYLFSIVKDSLVH